MNTTGLTPLSSSVSPSDLSLASIGDEMAWSDGLNPATPAFQIAGSTNQRVRVVAGPGTGKSFAMKRRVARLLEDGVAPGAILPVTFTRVAAEDLHRELVGMGERKSPRLKSSH